MDDRLLGIVVDSFTKILIPGIRVTIPLTVLSFSFAMVIAVTVAMIQFANVKVLKQISRFYIWVVRGTPAGTAICDFLRPAQSGDHH